MRKRYLLVAALLASCAYESEQGENSAEAPLVINEVATNNCTGLVDAYGKTSNWIELYNRSNEPINLGDYYLSDDYNKLGKWQLGERILAPGAYEIVHASGVDYRDTTPAPKRSRVEIAWSYGWSDGMLDGGISWVKPYAFTKLDGENSDGSTAVSAQMFLGDCVEALGWEGETHVDVNLRTGDESGSNYLSLGKYNQIELHGYFEKGKKFDLSFMLNSWGNGEEEGIPYFSGLHVSFVGTGEESDIYSFQLNRSEYDNLIAMNEIKGIRLSHSNIEDTLEFTLNNITFSSNRGNFHSSFKLSSNGDELYLTDKRGGIVDSLTIPSLKTDCSYGRNQQGVISYFSSPTPGKENQEITLVDVATEVKPVTRGGFYKGSVEVVLQREPGCKLFYTLDGSEPTELSKEYTAPFTLYKTTVVRAIHIKDGSLAGSVCTETYFINETSEMPIVSITVDPVAMFDSTTGMYMDGPNASKTPPHMGGNYWNKDLILDANVEFFENQKVRGFKRPFGLKIHGGWSRGAPKKSLALMFKEQYGEGALEYPVFPDYPDARLFKSLILRMGGDHGNDVIVYDVLNSYLTKGRNIEYQKSRSAQVFINGQYWGLYNIREKLNEHYFTTNFGLDGNEVNMVKDGGIVQQGSVADYVKLIEYIRHHDISESHVYNYVKAEIDVYNYIDYMASQIFIVNNDWPSNNIKWWKSNTPGSKWRWIMYDTDGAGLDDETYVDFNMIEFVTNSDKKIDYPNGADFTFLFRRLLRNSEFKTDFINRTMTLLSTNFHPDIYKSKLSYLLSFIGEEYKRDFDRWRIPYENWSEKMDNMNSFSDQRPAIVRKHLQEHFDLSEPVSITLSSEKGEVTINGLTGGASLKGEYFSDIPLTLSVSDSSGFKQWSDGETSIVRTVTPINGLQLTAEF